MTKRIGYCLAAMTLLATTASAKPITFSTTAVFSGGLSSNSNVFFVINGPNMASLTFNGTTKSVDTDAGALFGDIVVDSTFPPGVLGPGLGGNFTLTFTQNSPAGSASVIGNLSGSLGNGTATLAFAADQQSVVLPGGFVYTVNPSYTIGQSITATDSNSGGIQGTVTAAVVPDSGSTLMLLGSAFLGVAALRRRFTV